MANTYISRSTTSGTDTIWTWSGWIKRSKLGTSQTFFGTGNGSSSANSLQIRFSDDDTLDYRNFVSSNYNGRLSGGRKYRDTSAWYHFVFVWDTTQVSSGNRMKAYVNGELITGFTDIRDPSQNSSAHTSGSSTFIGTDGYGGSTYFDGSLSHVHFIDGTAYDASAFGETDATTGEWKAKTSPSVTYGNNGFFILKDGNGITDQSGEGNDFTLGAGTLTDLKDNPDNVFATMNTLVRRPSSSYVFSNGNNRVRFSTASQSFTSTSTLGSNTGKWYAECKIVSSTSASTVTVGASRLNYSPDWWETSQGELPYKLGGISLNENGYVYWDENGSGTSANLGTTFAQNDIIGIAIDLDSTPKKIYFYKNGTIINSSGQSISDLKGYSSDDVLGFCHGGTHNSGDDVVVDWNFGNGYFGTTAVSSAGTNASNNGIFEYDVPTGYTALSTKGLNL